MRKELGKFFSIPTNFLLYSIRFVIILIFCFFAYWQLCILAGLIAGLFYPKMSKGSLHGTLGVGTAWLCFIILEITTSNVEKLIDQTSEIVIGSTSLGWVFIILIILLGFVFGALRGAIGSEFRIAFTSRKKEGNLAD